MGERQLGRLRVEEQRGGIFVPPFGFFAPSKGLLLASEEQFRKVQLRSIGLGIDDSSELGSGIGVASELAQCVAQTAASVDITRSDGQRLSKKALRVLQLISAGIDRDVCAVSAKLLNGRLHRRRGQLLMEIGAVEQEPRMGGKDLPGFRQMSCCLGQITFMEEMRRNGAIPEQYTSVTARCWRNRFEHLTAHFPVHRPATPTQPPAVIDCGVLIEIAGDEDRDVGMQRRASPQRLVAVEDFLDLFEIESPVVKDDGRPSTAIANEPDFAESAITSRQ